MASKRKLSKRMRMRWVQAGYVAAAAGGRLSACPLRLVGARYVCWQSGWWRYHQEIAARHRRPVLDDAPPWD